MRKFKIKEHTPSDDELSEQYGNHKRFSVGTCLKDNNGHIYRQNEENVLHLYKNEIINSLHNSSLTKKELDKIDPEIFEDTLKNTIFELNLFNFFIPKTKTK